MLVVQRAARCDMLGTFLDLKGGEHAAASWMNYLKVTEFELEPQPRTPARPGFLAVDGEVWPLTGTHVQVLPSKLTLLGVAGAAD